MNVEFTDIIFIETNSPDYNEELMNQFMDWHKKCVGVSCNWILAQLPNKGKIIFPRYFVDNFYIGLDDNGDIKNAISNHEVAIIFNIVMSYETGHLHNGELLVDYIKNMPLAYQREINPRLDRLLKKLNISIGLN